MGKDMTQRTTRGVGLESLLKTALRAPLAVLSSAGPDAAHRKLKEIIESQKASFAYAIDRSILPRLRQREAAKRLEDRKGEDVLRVEARDILLHDFDVLLMGALGLHHPAFMKQILELIEEIPAFGAGEFRRTNEARLLPRNPIAYLWAILEAYESGEPVNDILTGESDVFNRNAQHAGRAAEFLRALKLLTAKDAAGYAKVQRLRMSAAETVAEVIPASAPVPVAEMPNREVEVRSVVLMFTGKDELALLEALEAAAAKHGGLEKFLLLLAAKLPKKP